MLSADNVFRNGSNNQNIHGFNLLYRTPVLLGSSREAADSVGDGAILADGDV